MDFITLPFISVIIPVYNDGIRLSMCIEALLEQNYPKDEYEIIIVDNGSTDKTPDFARKYPVQVFFELNKQNSYAARNKGLQHSKGEVMAFTDSDCIASPNWLSEGIEAMDNFGTPYVAGKIISFFQNETPNIWEYYDSAVYFDQKGYIQDSKFGVTANLFVDKRLFNKYGLFRQDLISGGDYEFGRRISKSREKIAFAENAVVFHPARSKFREALKKSKRVSIGQQQLKKMGLLEHNLLTWRSLFPPKRIPCIDGKQLKLHRRISLWLIISFFKYHRLFYRIYPCK